MQDANTTHLTSSTLFPIAFFSFLNERAKHVDF